MIKELTEKLFEYYNEYQLFGIILFTDSHPNVAKALKDELYFAALDEISGENILIFATMLFRPRLIYPTPPAGVFTRIEPIWEEPCANIEVLSWFNIDSRDRLPIFVVFGFDSNNLYYYTHPIQSESPGNVFDSLQQILNIITKQMKKNKTLERKKLFKRLGWKIKMAHATQTAKEVLQTISLFRSVTGI